MREAGLIWPGGRYILDMALAVGMEPRDMTTAVELWTSIQ
jgi:hypothetical protein